MGIATGLVVVGDLIGSGEAQERGIVGETPNLAARLQGIAEPNTVVIAESTRKLLGNLFELHDLPADAPADEPAARYADTQPVTATPAMPIPDAIKLLEGQSEPRLIVLDEDGATLRGLLVLQPGLGRVLRALVPC